MSKGGNPVIFLYRMMWKYSKGRRRVVSFFTGLFFLNNLVEFLRPLIIGFLLNTIQEQGVNQGNIRFLLMMTLLFPLFTFVAWAFHGPARVLERRNAFFVRNNYKQYLLDGTLALPASWHTDHHSGDTIDKINKGTNALYEFSEDTFQVIGATLILVTSVAALAYFHPLSAVISVAAVVVAFALVLIYDARLDPQYKAMNRRENAISAKIYDVISNITTVIILRLESLVSKDIARKMLQPKSIYFENVKITEWKWFWVNMVGSVMKLLVFGTFFLATYRSHAVLAIGTIFLLNAYVDRIEDIFFRFAWMYSGYVVKRAQVANAEELATQFQTTKLAAPRELRNWKTIAFKDLAFSYHEGIEGDLHLNDVSFEIHRGQKIAVIGESGSGKTTLLKVLRGLYPVARVTVMIDGKPEPLGIGAVSNGVALIPQDPEIFATTIRENITVGLDRSAATIRRYTDMARFSDVVKRLPHGLDSSIVEKGVNLSGGERQRLALARGLMAADDKSLVFLDEPTSSVDTKNEFAIYQQVFRAFRDKAIISSIHRLHLLPLFDRILFFRNGKIIAAGSFDELLESSPEFKQLYARQSKVHEERA